MNTQEQNFVNTEEFGEVECIGANAKFVNPVIAEKSVVERLSELLPKADFHEIRADFIDKLNYKTHNMEDFVDLLQDELSFHRTVNQLIEAKEKPTASYGKIPLEEVAQEMV